jgi:hypothetical protein
MIKYGMLQNDKVPGPQSLIQIYNPSHASTELYISATIDSGAVATCIPEECVRDLGNLVRMPPVNIKTSYGSLSAEVYIIGLRFPEFEASFPDLRVISIPNIRYAIIGRDILNQYKVVMDGPSSIFRLSCNLACNHPEHYI